LDGDDEEDDEEGSQEDSSEEGRETNRSLSELFNFPAESQGLLMAGLTGK